MSRLPKAALASAALLLAAAGPQAPTRNAGGTPAPIRCTTPSSIGCVAQRAVQQARAAPRQELRGNRYVPPPIQAFLNLPKIDPLTRAFLWSVAVKQTEDWTLSEYQTTTQLVPVLAETAVPTRVLSDFYEFLGLDPTSLFDAQLSPTAITSGFDAKSLQATEQAQCFYLLGYGEVLDTTKVTLKDVAACTGG